MSRSQISKMSLLLFNVHYIEYMKWTEHMRVILIGLKLIVVIFATLAFSACSDSDKPSEVVTPINANFLDADLTAGYYCFCWNQYYNENLATIGDYKLRMVAGTYDNTFNFAIKQSMPHRAANECCDTATTPIFTLEKMAKGVPDYFGVAIDTNAYASGDTIHVEIAVPEDTRVKLEISPILTQ